MPEINNSCARCPIIHVSFKVTISMTMLLSIHSHFVVYFVTSDLTVISRKADVSWPTNSTAELGRF